MTETNLEKEVKATTEESETSVVTYDGVEYNVPSTIRLWPLEVIEAQEEGKSLAMIKALLGPEQFATFRKGHDGKQRTFGEFTDLSDALIKAALSSGK